MTKIVHLGRLFATFVAAGGRFVFLVAAAAAEQAGRCGLGQRRKLIGRTRTIDGRQLIVLRLAQVS